MRLPTALTGVLEIALNEFVTGDAHALRRCADLDGRSLSLHIQDMDLELYLLPHPGGLLVAERLEDTPDVRLSASLRSFAQTLFAGSKPGSGESIIGRGLRIEGDVGLAQDFAAMLQSVDLNIEDWLEPRVGDVPAQLLGRALRGAGGFAQRALDSLTLDTAEYLREETRDLVHRDEINQWLREVDELRADADRLAARVRRIDSR